jgi:type I restriction enzyme S subunit
MSKVAHTPQLRFPEFSGDWEEKKLSDISDVRDGTHESPKYVLDGFPLITSKNLLSNGSIDFENINLVSEEDYTNINKRSKVDINDILFGMIGTIGNPVIVKETGFAIKNVALIKQQKELLNKFMIFYLSGNSIAKQFYIENTGGTQKFLALGVIRSLKIKFPPDTEQQKIAAFLTAVDNKIEQLSKKQELLGEYKKGLMQQIFSQAIRFKADDGSDFPDWKENKVDEFMEVTRGQVLAVPEMRQVESEIFKYPVYSSQTKNNGLTGYYTDYLFEDCITWTTDGANAGDVNYRAGKFYCTNVCGVLRSKKGYANLCIAQILNSVSRRYVSYVGNPKLMNNVMEKIKISIPSSINEQTKIANFLSSVDSKIEEVGKQLDESKQFKKALLQKMFV